VVFEGHLRLSEHRLRLPSATRQAQAQVSEPLEEMAFR